ncbi:hypothetical protein GQX73_g9837 [Xylaria multiplex]|uniref:Uncharacterized protein n=1 Tax=Xylaria multiplex TaxID=323545 RepID=A0A7C8MJ83_9PEZI|nr:hypothetical protein GQX73_g9837 [Xylaria multiplex]
MGCRWPGGVRDNTAFWELLSNRKNGYMEFGDDHRFSTKGFYHPTPTYPGCTATLGGFLLQEDARLFDPTFFGIQPLEVETLDASQRKLLEVVYEACENAGETLDSLSGSRTGVFIGNFTTEQSIIQNRDPDHPRPYTSTGCGLSLLSNRISYIFNLRGPSMTVDTACSSSMYALHLAVQAINNGDCDAAIVAASNWIFDPTMQIMMSRLGALSASSACHTFDASADGYARGEGFAALYLKSKGAAVHDLSPIRAFIRGTAINANGRTAGITHPSRLGQEAVIRAAYRNAGNLRPQDTSYFECHGTGTPVGDPIEIAAIGDVFSHNRSDDDPLYIGSVKTNIGHTESASAIAGIMKVVLALETGLIPPSIGIKTLNPEINFAKARVKVLTDLTSWPKGRLRRASVNSFGFGGANGHCIIDHVNNVLPGYHKPGVIFDHKPFACQYLADRSTKLNDKNLNGCSPKELASTGVASNIGSPNLLSITRKPQTRPDANAITRQLVLLPFSAHNEASVTLNINALGRTLGRHSLADVAYTLAEKRSRLSSRSFRIVSRDAISLEGSLQQPTSASPVRSAKLGFVFTGQGAQWHAMGRELLQYRVFKDTINHIEQVLSMLTPETMSWTVSEVLLGNCPEGLIDQPLVSQTVCTALQIGLVDLLASWSIHPDAVIGHSSGEIAAAYAAGWIGAAEAISVAFCRGYIVTQNRQKGLMLAVGLGPEEIIPYLQGYHGSVNIAAVNAPNSVTLSGNVESVTRLSADLEKDQVFNRKLKTGNNAYHSYHMKPLKSQYSTMLVEYLEALRQGSLIRDSGCHPRVQWISTVNPEKITTVKPSNCYWAENLVNPVQFSNALSSLTISKSNPIDAFVEIGPHHALKGPSEQVLRSSGRSIPYLGSLVRCSNGQLSLLELCGRLFCLNSEVNLAAVNSTDEGEERIHGCTAVDLPPYQYAYGPLNYYESRISKEYRHRTTRHHDLIGSRLPGASNFRPQWRNILCIDDVRWLSDHRLARDVVLPAAAYIAMAIEAATQAFCDAPDSVQITGYSLRNVSIQSALKIPEDDYGVEVLLSLDLAGEATTTTPTWVNFSISSVTRDDNTWTQHCTGSVRVCVSQKKLHSKIATNMDSRHIDKESWYTKFHELGLNYGPIFRRISNVEADPSKKIVRAQIDMKKTSGLFREAESSYPLHPASLDALFQLVLIAIYGGQTEKARTAFIPLEISQLYIKYSNTDSWGVGVAKGQRRGLRGAYADIQLQDQNGSLILDLTSLRCINFDGPQNAFEAKNSLNRPFSSPLARLIWKPDIRFITQPTMQALYPQPKMDVDRASLFHSINSIATLTILNIYTNYCSNFKQPENCSREIHHFLSWVRRRVLQDKTEGMLEATAMSNEERQHRLAALYKDTGNIVEVKIIKLLYANIDDIIHGRRTGVEILVGDGLLTALYETGFAMIGAYPQLGCLLDGLGHINPHQKILELGGGTGGATRVAMKALTIPETGIKRYSHFVFTDISPGFIEAAKKFLAVFHDVSYSVLDMERDPIEQGHDSDYDVVIASQCLHATPSISRSLENCRKLLKPGGKLVFVENTQSTISHGLILGTLTGYWDGVPDGRTDSPFLDLPSWDKALRGAGFSGTEIVLEDHPRPYSTASTILSTSVGPQLAAPETQRASPVHLLNGLGRTSDLLRKISNKLQRQGIVTIENDLDTGMSTIASDSNVIAFLGTDYLLLDANATQLRLFQHLARSVAHMIVITSCGIVKGRNPDASIVSGLLRTIGTENPASRFVTIDIDDDNIDVDQRGLVRFIVDKHLELPNLSPDQTEDREFSWHDGCIWVSRVMPDAQLSRQLDALSLPAERSRLLPLDSQGPIRAEFETPGILSSLYFRPYNELWMQIPDDFIEVKVAAVGLNWKDLGISAGRFDADNLSSEYAGTVTKVGSAVTNFVVGDKVYGMGKGHFGNYTCVPSQFSHRLQPGDSMVEAATMPLVYMTAIFAFDYATNLKAGERVLIQSATGGLGLAAIRLAQSRGAEVYATVGTKEKFEFLATHAGVPRSRIFSSRDVDEFRNAVAATCGRGFDVILSVSKGEMLYESFRTLSPLGRLIDVGRMDVTSSKSLGLELFQQNISFISFDLGLVLDSDPSLGSKLMKAVDKYWRQGHIGPVNPYTVSDISQLHQVLLGFSKGTHIGKLVVSLANPESLVRMVPAVPAARFHSEAQYVITGGFGGLGRSIIRWMVERGAKYILCLSRSGANGPEAHSLVRDLAARGALVTPVICDIGVRKQVVEAIQKAKNGRPIKGIIHAAMSLHDVSFDKLSVEQWREALAAKVHGTKHLHMATLGLSLDFFVMITSIESVVALATQGAYTAANNFQEAFARYRLRQGLPASTVSFGLISGVGVLGHNATIRQSMDRNRVLNISEFNFLRSLEIAFIDGGKGSGSNPLDEHQDPLSSTSMIACLDPAAMAILKRKWQHHTDSRGDPRWYSDRRVSVIMRALEDDYKYGETQIDHNTDQSTGAQSSVLEQLKSGFQEGIRGGPAARDKTRSLVAGAIVGTVASLLSIEVSNVSTAKPVAHYGVDSLIAAELRNWFALVFRTDIPMLDVLDMHNTIEKLAELVVDGALVKMEQTKNQCHLATPSDSQML